MVTSYQFLAKVAHQLQPSCSLSNYPFHTHTGTALLPLPRPSAPRGRHQLRGRARAGQPPLPAQAHHPHRAGRHREADRGHRGRRRRHRRGAQHPAAMSGNVTLLLSYGSCCCLDKAIFFCICVLFLLSSGFK